MNNITLQLPHKISTIGIEDVESLFSEEYEENNIFSYDNYFLYDKVVIGVSQKNRNDIPNDFNFERWSRELPWATGLVNSNVTSKRLKINNIDFIQIESRLCPPYATYNEIFIASDIVYDKYGLNTIVLYPAADSVQVRKEVDKMLHSVRFID